MTRVLQRQGKKSTGASGRLGRALGLAARGTCGVAWVGLLLAGCVTSPGREGEGGDFASDVTRVTRAYLVELSDEARVVAEEIESGTVRSNGSALARFQESSRAARERWNQSLGAAMDARHPPGGPVDPSAWRELSQGLRRAAGR